MEFRFLPIFCPLLPNVSLFSGWDDEDDTDEDFIKQLREELEKYKAAQKEEQKKSDNKMEDA